MAKSDTDTAADQASEAAPAQDPAPDPAPAQTAGGASFDPPIDTTGITFSTGREVRVGDDGKLTAPADLTDDEALQLRRTGFTPA